MNADFCHLTPRDYEDTCLFEEHLKGKVVLILNMAFRCRFAPQYKDLGYLKRKYKGHSLRILAFPCNQFSHQKPGADQEIGKCCVLNLCVSFRLLKKIDVNGTNADLVYKHLTDQKSGSLGRKSTKLHFKKFLADLNGIVVDRFSSPVNRVALEAQLKALLAAAD